MKRNFTTLLYENSRAGLAFLGGPDPVLWCARLTPWGFLLRGNRMPVSARTPWKTSRSSSGGWLSRFIASAFVAPGPLLHILPLSGLAMTGLRMASLAPVAAACRRPSGRRRIASARAGMPSAGAPGSVADRVVDRIGGIVKAVKRHLKLGRRRHLKLGHPGRCCVGVTVARRGLRPLREHWRGGSVCGSGGRVRCGAWRGVGSFPPGW